MELLDLYTHPAMIVLWLLFMIATIFAVFIKDTREGRMRKSIIAGIVGVLILILIFKSDAFQENFFPERFYINEVDKLEKRLKDAEQVVYFHYKLFKSAERDAQKDYVEYLQLFRESEPNADYDSLRVEAQRIVSDNVLTFHKALQDAIDGRNDIHRELQEVKNRRVKFQGSTP